MESPQELSQLYALLSSLLAPQGVVLLTLNHPDYVSKRHHFYQYILPPAATISAPFARVADNDPLTIQIYNGTSENESLHFFDIWWSTQTLVQRANEAGLTLIERIDLHGPEHCDFPSYLQLVFCKRGGAA